MIKTQTEYYKNTAKGNGITITVNEDVLLSFDELSIQVKQDVPDIWMSSQEYKAHLSESIVAITEIEKLYGKETRDSGGL